MLTRNLIVASRVFAFAAFVAVLSMATDRAHAGISIFHETFDGYNYFPDEFPANDPINLGLPLISEGADEIWFGGRFEKPDTPISNDPIQDIHLDLAVQKFSGGGNSTRSGRAGDDAGLILRVPQGFKDIKMWFDWRTFSAGSNDRIVVGYHVGDLGFNATTRIIDFYGDFVDANGGDEDAGQDDAVAWWNDEWVELMRKSPNNTFQTEMFHLPDTTGTEPVWVAFWVDNGDKDFIKLDNIWLKGSPMPIPEPASAGLFACGAMVLAMRGRRRRNG